MPGYDVRKRWYDHVLTVEIVRGDGILWSSAWPMAEWMRSELSCGLRCFGEAVPDDLIGFVKDACARFDRQMHEGMDSLRNDVLPHLIVGTAFLESLGRRGIIDPCVVLAARDLMSEIERRVVGSDE